MPDEPVAVPEGFKGTRKGVLLECLFDGACDESSNGDKVSEFLIKSSYEPYGTVRVTVEVRHETTLDECAECSSPNYVPGTHSQPNGD